MTTFQAVIYAIVHAIGEFFPIGARAQQTLIPYLVGWQPPMDALIGALSLGSLLALFIYFRHDWASMISCFLQVIIYRKRPMTLDERLPLFIAFSTIPLVISSTYFRDRMTDIQWTPFSISIVLALLGILLWFFDRIGRKTKGMFDWNWLDAGVIGLSQAASFIPGWDHFSGVLLGALFLNYRRESAAKYAYFAAAPILFAQTFVRLREINFHASSPVADLSWLSFGVAAIVSLLVGLLVIGGFMKHIQNKGLGQYVAYRCLLAAGACVLFWLKK